MNRLIDWCLSRDYNNDRKVLKSTIQLTAFMLASFLISSNNSLRDRTTKALVNLLIGRIDIVIATLEKYKQMMTRMLLSVYMLWPLVVLYQKNKQKK